MNVLLSSKFRSQCLRPRQGYHKDPLPSWTSTTSKLDTHSIFLGQGKVLHFCISQRSGVLGFQHLPLPIVGVAMLLVRCCIPGRQEYLARQDFVQGLHPDQSERTQSASQVWVLHASDSPLAGHLAPPWSSGVSTPRVRDSLPPPHCAVHSLQGLRSFITQSIGQGTLAQSRSTSSGGQDAPYLPSSVLLDHPSSGSLLMIWMPLLPSASRHVPEHSPTTQSLIMQSWIINCGFFPSGFLILLYTACRILRRPHISLSNSLHLS